MIDRHDFERLRGLDDEMTDICNIRVAFASEKRIWFTFEGYTTTNPSLVCLRICVGT